MPTFDKSDTKESAAQKFLVEGNQCPLHQNVTIETLPDDILLAIFITYLDLSDEIEVWHTLVHVCQRWRCLVFASPGHLNLRLECTVETRGWEMLDIWPPFPIVILDESDSMYGMDNIIAGLGQRDRVSDITLNIPGYKMDMLLPEMLGQFPALERILLVSDDSVTALVPESFLGGSAPQLKWLTLYNIPFPALPTLLSSTRNLVDLQLSGIPRSGYISPEVMVSCLSAMPNLGNLRFEFDSEVFPNRESRPHPSPVARSTLPALRELIFEGANEYFEDLVVRIDTPEICELKTTFFPRHFYDFSQLSQFIGRVEVFKSPDHVNIDLRNGLVELFATCEPARLLLGTSHNKLRQRLQYLVQVCSSSLLPFSNVESLAIFSEPERSRPIAEDFLWLDLLRPFSAVKVLEIHKDSLTPVAYVLKDVVEGGITEMFPAIQELSIGEYLPLEDILRVIEKFATARGLTTRLDHPYYWVAG